MKTSKVSSAQLYDHCDDLGIVSCYFNPEGYQTKLDNYGIFAERIEASDLYLITVECAFGEMKYALKPSARTIQLRSDCILWQKERLLNIAVSRLPETITKVAWLDCDVLFSNPNWAVQTSRLLDTVPIVQPFAELFRLPRGSVAYDGEGERSTSFGYVWNTKPDPSSEACSISMGTPVWHGLQEDRCFKNTASTMPASVVAATTSWLTQCAGILRARV